MMPALRVMLFFPSVTFGGLAAEIFPWALLYMLSQSKRAWRGVIWAGMAGLFCLLLAMLFQGTGLPPLGQALRSFLAYMNGLLVFVWLMRAPKSQIDPLLRLIEPVFLSLLTLGVLQWSGVLVALDPLFAALVPRASATALSDMGRGVTLLATEPSRAGFEMILLYATLRLTRPRYGWISDLIFMAFLMICIQALSSLLLAGIFFASLWRGKMLMMLPLLGLVWLVIDPDQGRLHSLAQGAWAVQSWDAFYDKTLRASGFRVTSLLGSGLYGLSHPFGGGVGNWQTSMTEALPMTGIDPARLPYFASRFGGAFAPVRPTSVAGNLLLDVGIFGFVLVSLLLGKIIAKSRPARRVWPMLVLVGFSYLAFGGAGHPLPWMLLALSLRAHAQGLAGCLAGRPMGHATAPTGAPSPARGGAAHP